jgi:hypothetical protein
MEQAAKDLAADYKQNGNKDNPGLKWPLRWKFYIEGQ